MQADICEGWHPGQCGEEVEVRKCWAIQPAILGKGGEACKVCGCGLVGRLGGGAGQGDPHSMQIAAAISCSQQFACTALAQFLLASS